MKLTVNAPENLQNLIDGILSQEATSKSSKIKGLFELGLEVKEISEMLNIRYNFAYNVISNYVIINDLQVEKADKASKKDEVINLYLAGKTNIEISRELKTNYNYIYKILKEYKAEQEAKAAK